MALNRKSSRPLIQLKPEETLVSGIVQNSSLTFLFSPFLFSSKLIPQFLFYRNSKLVYRCRGEPDLGLISVPVNGALVIVTDAKVIWFAEGQSGELEYSSWYQSEFRVIHFFTTQAFSGTQEQANNLFDDYYCKVNDLPSRSDRKEVPAPLVEAFQREVKEAEQLLKSSGEMQPTGADANTTTETVEPDMRRASALYAKRSSTADLWKVLDDIEDDMPVDRDAHSSYATRSSQQRSKSGSMSTTGKPVEDEDNSLGEPGPAIVGGQYKDDNGLEYTSTRSSKPLLHSASASVSTTHKSAKGVEDSWSEEPGATFGIEERKEDDLDGANDASEGDDGYKCNTTRPLSTIKTRPPSNVLIYASPPEEETPPPVWRRFVSWVCPCLYGDDKEQGIKVETEIKTIEVFETEPEQVREEMTMGLKQEKPDTLVAPPMERETKKWVPVEGQPF